MRIALQLIWKHVQEPLEEVELLNLSGNKISGIDQLEHCPSLQSLILSNNSISVLHNLTSCQQLWSLDLTGNRVKSLHGLSKFPVLGSLKLSYNELEWAELARLSHMTLLSLTLSGNPQLDSDPYYREHVVDLLPNLWALDNRIITASERRHVSQFFLKSETFSQPVWRKASERVFVPSFMKDLLVNGVFGKKTTHLMAHFPASYTHNTEMDRRRLHYLAHTLEEDIKLHMKYSKEMEEMAVPGLCQMLETRNTATEQSTTMLLILLLAHLEYGLPHDLLMETLETAKLTKIGDVEVVGVFHLPTDMMLGVATLFLGAAAIDRQDKKEGGVYKKLFSSLNFAVDSLQRKAAATTAGRSLRAVRSPRHRDEEVELKSLLASEVVRLLCLVTQFFSQITTHPGLLQLVCVATSNPQAGDIISDVIWKVQARGGTEWDMYNDVSTFLVTSTSDVVQGKRRRGIPSRRGRHGSGVHRTTSQLLHPSMQHPRSSVQTRALSAGHTSRPRPLHPYPNQPHPPNPQLGLMILEDHHRTFWKREDLDSDLSEIPLESLSVDPGPVSRETTPDPTRHHSEASVTSELELQNVPSDPEEVVEDSGGELGAVAAAQPPMRVEITDTSRPPSRTLLLNTDEAKIEHQKKVLTKLTLASGVPHLSPTPPPSPPHLPPTSIDITIPSPQLHFAEKWERSKSVVSCAAHSPGKQHSCEEPSPYPPRLPPSPPPPSPPPPSPPLSEPRLTADFPYPTATSSSSSRDSLQQPGDGLVLHAWSPVKSLPRPRQSLLSSARLMNRRETTNRPPFTSHPKCRTTSAPAGHQRSDGSRGVGGATTVVFRPKTTKLYQSPPKHMNVYAAHSTMRPSPKHHFSAAHPSCKAPGSRLLGDLRALYVGGTSIT